MLPPLLPTPSHGPLALADAFYSSGAPVMRAWPSQRGVTRVSDPTEDPSAGGYEMPG